MAGDTSAAVDPFDIKSNFTLSAGCACHHDAMREPLPDRGSFEADQRDFETMARDTGERHERLAGDIRRQFGEGSTTRFLHAMPTFKVVDRLPRHLKILLDQLEETEGRKAKTSR
jgi:hypothetical protein